VQILNWQEALVVDHHIRIRLDAICKLKLECYFITLADVHIVARNGRSLVIRWCPGNTKEVTRNRRDRSSWLVRLRC